MKTFYVLSGKVAAKDIFIDKYKTPELYEEYYNRGVPIQEASESIQLFYKYKTGRKTDYINGIQLFPIISSRFGEILKVIKPAEFELHTVELICKKTKETDRSFLFLNILENVSCFDWKKSIYKTVPGTEDIIVSISKMAINEDRLQTRDIARVSEVCSVILISDRLRRLLESANLTGMEFEDPEKFQLL